MGQTLCCAADTSVNKKDIDPSYVELVFLAGKKTPKLLATRYTANHLIIEKQTSGEPTEDLLGVPNCPGLLGGGHRRSA